MVDADDLGPLPAIDEKWVLQQESLRALRAAVPADGFVLRDERTDDFGVDATLELRLHGKATNFRSQVQVKARSGLQPLAGGGGFSVEVPTANLNYLLHGRCPIYVLYRPETKELRYAFARDEERRIAASTPSWRKQAEVALHFSDVLDPVALDLIRDRIIAESTMHRRLHDIVSSVAGGDHVKVAVDPTTLDVTAPDDAAQTLAASGMDLVSNGFGGRVLELMGVLSPDHFRRDAKLLVVRGFAEFSNRNYYRADPSFREALSRRAELPPDLRAFVAFLSSTVDLAVGNLTQEQYFAGSAAWTTDASPAVRIQYDILISWMQWSGSLASAYGANDPRYADAEVRLRAVLDRAASIAGLPRAISLHAAYLRLFLEGRERLDAVLQAVAISHDPVIWRSAYDDAPAAVLAREQGRIVEWRARLGALMHEAAALGHMPLYLEVRFGIEISEVFVLSQLDLFASFVGGQPPAVPDEVVERLRETRRLAAAQDHVEIELRTMLLEGDLEDLRGDRDAVMRLAQEVLDKSEALRFADVARMARRMLAGTESISARRREIEALRAPSGYDVATAALSDSMLEDKARHACEVLRLPADRMPVMRDAARCEREVSRQRLFWCRHLRVLESDEHAMSPSTTYARVPERACFCEHFHDRRSAFPSTDWHAVIDAFKKAYCSACPSREPFQSTAG